MDIFHTITGLDCTTSRVWYSQWRYFCVSSILCSSVPVTEDLPALSVLLPYFYKSLLPMMVGYTEVSNWMAQSIQGKFLLPPLIRLYLLWQRLCRENGLDFYKVSLHVVIMGGSHLRMSFWNILRDLLKISGWNTVLTKAEEIFMVKLKLCWGFTPHSNQTMLIVHFELAKAINTFNKYTEKVSIPYVNKQLKHSNRLDIMWGAYVP